MPSLPPNLTSSGRVNLTSSGRVEAPSFASSTILKRPPQMFHRPRLWQEEKMATFFRLLVSANISSSFGSSAYRWSEQGSSEGMNH